MCPWTEAAEMMLEIAEEDARHIPRHRHYAEVEDCRQCHDADCQCWDQDKKARS